MLLVSTILEIETLNPSSQNFQHLIDYFWKNFPFIFLGNFTATNSEYLTRTELRNMYMTLLGTDDKDYLSLKIQTLKNLELFLSAEETKMTKNNSECKFLL